MLATTGLRRGEALGLRLSDLHFLPTSTSLGCPVEGPHVHVLPRPNSNRARVKNEKPRVVPAATRAGRAIEAKLIELDRRFSPYYWTNIGDDALPFVGLIEHTNLIAPERYGGRRFLYVANYLPRGHELLGLDADTLLKRYAPGLQAVNPQFDRGWVKQLWLHREPAAQPIVTVGYRQKIPAMKTPTRGLVLANTTQIFPEDRGTNYAVREGDEAARAMLDWLP